MNPEEWKAGGRLFDYLGHWIFFRDEGRGAALLCIHGFPTSSWDWHKIWGDVARRFHVIAADMIGFGFSAKPVDYEYSILDQATLHERLLEFLGVGSVHVLAHDYGDTVAQELLARFEERKASGAPGIELRTICFLNGGLFPEAHRALPVQKLLSGPLGPLLSRFVSESAFRRGFSAVFGPHTQPSVQELHDFWSIINVNDGGKISHKLLGYIAERKRHRERWVGALRKTTVPLRFINGPLDPVSGAHMAERYRELVPKPDVVMLEGIGHYPQVEDPSGTLGAFLEFVDRKDSHGS
jgi:pimeloyl-ACP methyl ester carboxylesterase